jgi:predicted DNA-binding transcriptional regulator YafY
MRRAERLFRIVAEVRDGKVFTAQALADKLEVSERTVYRDIAHLQASGVPIDGEAGIGYVARPGFELPPLTFTVEQLEALALGAAMVIAAADRDLAEAAKSARAKIDAVLPAERRGAVSASPMLAARRAEAKAPRSAAALRQAIRERRIVTFDYTRIDGQRSTRRVRPLAMTSFTDGWMLGAWCEARRDFRDFRLDRMTRVALTPDRFTPGAACSLEAYLARYDRTRKPSRA